MATYWSCTEQIFISASANVVFEYTQNLIVHLMNHELLSIATNTNVHRVEKHIVNCFEYTYGLEVALLIYVFV